MSRDRHSRRRGNQNKNREQKRKDADSLLPKKSLFHPSRAVLVSSEQMQQEDEAIRSFKSESHSVCPKCGQPVNDLTSAIPDKTTGNPMHFDCALEIVGEHENLGSGDKIVYIGQGRFGVVNFANPRDLKHFTIKKVIEWEEKDSRSPWRDRLSELYSQTK